MRKAWRYRWLTGLMCTVGVATLTAATARADVIFQDGFESGNITAGGWTSSGAVTVDGSAYNGNYAARIDDSGYFRKVVSTQGYEQIELEYARYTYGYDRNGNRLYKENQLSGTKKGVTTALSQSPQVRRLFSSAGGRRRLQAGGCGPANRHGRC